MKCFQKKATSAAENKLDLPRSVALDRNADLGSFRDIAVSWSRETIKTWEHWGSLCVVFTRGV